MRSDGAEPAACEPIHGQGRRLLERRQLRGGRRHGARPGGPAAERRHDAAGERAAHLAARLVQVVPQRHLRLARRYVRTCHTDKKHKSIHDGTDRSTFKLICHVCGACSDCAKKLANGLFLVGEIGGNDYNYAFLQGTRSIDTVKSYVPQVINTIMDVTKVRSTTSLTRMSMIGRNHAWFHYLKHTMLAVIRIIREKIVTCISYQILWLIHQVAAVNTSHKLVGRYTLMDKCMFN
jgi:hypothetical protein